jgi:hypothetical protein
MSVIQGDSYNLAQKEVLNLSGFLNLIATLMEQKIDVVYLPESYLNMNGISSDISPFSGKWVSYLDPSRAENELNFRSTPLKSWLPEVIDYFLTQYQGSIPENYRYRSQEIKLLDKLNRNSDNRL